ncbi:hypothetical protein BLNAU_9051 [Blattamonas nauphoetae]|uniref:Uncharacterized protein n=1 Tax=Blattamonas nauphoetae TaxID=2049346 RepID=A0ABQ9XX80_9EUKA|nr:hypothetical protein BLNAU_9051 [Blattamonas nauphoetae]
MLGWLKHTKTVDSSLIGPDSFRAVMMQWLRNARDEKEVAVVWESTRRVRVFVFTRSSMYAGSVPNCGMVASSSLRLPILSFATPQHSPPPFDLPPDQPTQPSLTQHATQQYPSQSESQLLFVFNLYRAREFARDEDRMGVLSHSTLHPKESEETRRARGNAKVTADEAFVLLQNLIGIGHDQLQLDRLISRWPSV